MEPFRPTRGGGARASLAPAEASLLRSLVGQVISLIAPDGPPAPQAADGPLAEWEAELTGPAEATGQTQASDDPVLARLLPDGYRDDPQAAEEFRKYTESGLRSAKQQAAQEMLDTLPEARRPDPAQPRPGHGLAQGPERRPPRPRRPAERHRGVRGAVGGWPADDPQWAAYEVYAWLGAVQESLVQALA